MNRIDAIYAILIKVFEKGELLSKHLGRNFGDISVSEVHCIEQISRIEEANVTKLSEGMELTRGAVSKLTKKLLQKGVIEKYQKPENKKEIYFKLNDQGKEICLKHHHEHQKLEEGFKKLLARYEDQETLLLFLTDLNEAFKEMMERETENEH
ncbi:MarR family transcriptional regulator [Desulforamulus ruminis]|uniref:MarR family transcriptional regulator n=1 Tax=Desulforamulus ruminis TaxID=1564 RepID=UPI002FDB13E5